MPNPLSVLDLQKKIHKDKCRTIFAVLPKLDLSEDIESAYFMNNHRASLTKVIQLEFSFPFKAHANSRLQLIQSLRVCKPAFYERHSLMSKKFDI